MPAVCCICAHAEGGAVRAGRLKALDTRNWPLCDFLPVCCQSLEQDASGLFARSACLWRCCLEAMDSLLAKYTACDDGQWSVLAGVRRQIQPCLGLRGMSNRMFWEPIYLRQRLASSKAFIPACPVARNELSLLPK